MADEQTPAPTPRSGFTLDLSSGTSSAKATRPKGFVPVVQKTINLSTKKAEAPASAPAGDPTPRPEPRGEVRSEARSGAPRPDARNAPRRDGGRPDERRTDARREDRRDAPRPSGGTSLADLLDEATLARLRGK